ncbi:DUF6545 domain-containing protein [Agromyces sp. Marseille-Q5079]|uniref:DUF6545 domain-containing protein n=1 Tax=Agromyces sp. Marseille-Q5079 TaxID=3439059 RepID=UPI003D9CA319
MTSVIVAGLMWLLVAALLVLRRGRVERSITWASVAIAISMTLNIDPVYVALDTAAGGSNAVTLVADLALMTGVFLLGRGVMKAADDPPRAVRIALSRVTFGVALVSATIAFLLIERGATTTSFMLDLGEQPATAIYSMIHFTYYAVVLAAMATVAFAQIRVSRGILALPPALLVVGCGLGIALTVDVICMDLSHVAGNLDLMSAAAVLYGPLYLLTFLLLCSGFAGQPFVRAVRARQRELTTRELAARLAPLWQTASEVHPGISQNSEAEFDADDPEGLLHRQVVEIRDAMIDTRVTFSVSGADLEALEAAERHLVGATATPSASLRVRQ